MQLSEIIFTVMVSGFSLLLMIGSYILQRQNHWRRVWVELGAPEVGSIKELKSLSKANEAGRKLVSIHR